jgi:phosphoglycerate dehydrogenase-like enzyme
LPNPKCAPPRLPLPKIRTLLAALTPQEISDFLPEPQFSSVRALADYLVPLDPTSLGEEAFRQRLAAADPDVLLAGWKTPPLPDVLPSRLKYVCYLPGSVRKLVTRTHIENGLLVTNWGGSVSRVVAECALMLTLVCLRRAGHWIPAMRRPGVWKDPRMETASLFERRVGIHGFGLVARELIRLLKPFGVAIEVCAPETEPGLYAAHGARPISSLEDLFAKNDVVIELAPLNSSTIGIVTERLLRLIPEGGVFVNVGRGAVVDEAALLRVAREGRIQVGLDVYAAEPLPAESGLRSLPNVALLPHLGGPTPDRCRDAGTFGLKNLAAYAGGHGLESLISPEIYDVSS